MSHTELEALTQDYGREIFGRLGRSGPLLFSPRWWDDRLMEWSMSQKDVKVQLFRFVDVLPLLRTPAAIVRHLREYFAEAGEGVPGWLRLLLRLLPTLLRFLRPRWRIPRLPPSRAAACSRPAASSATKDPRLNV